jgi:hypothetical protein
MCVCATTLDGTLEMSLVSLQAYMTICANGVWSMVIYPKFMGLITIPQRAQFTHVLAMEHGAVQKGYGAQKKCRSNENHDDNPLELGGTLFFFGQLHIKPTLQYPAFSWHCLGICYESCGDIAQCSSNGMTVTSGWYRQWVDRLESKRYPKSSLP